MNDSVDGRNDWEFGLMVYLVISVNELGFPGSSAGKESICNPEDPSLIPGLGRFPGEGIGYPLQYSYLGNPHRQRSLVGYRTQDMGSQSQTQLSDKA